MEIDPAALILITTAAAALPSTLVFLSTRRGQRGTDLMRPSAIHTAEAASDAVDIDSLGKIYGMYRGLTVDIAEVLERERKNKIIQIDHEEQILSLTRNNKRLTEELTISRSETTAALAEVASLKQQIIDYPKRVQDLEEIIVRMQGVMDKQEEEINRLRGRAESADASRDNADAARLTEADTANTLAHNAEVNIADALATPVPDAAAHVVTDEEVVSRVKSVIIKPEDKA